MTIWQSSSRIVYIVRILSYENDFKWWFYLKKIDDDLAAIILRFNASVSHSGHVCMNLRLPRACVAVCSQDILLTWGTLPRDNITALRQADNHLITLNCYNYDTVCKENGLY